MRRTPGIWVMMVSLLFFTAPHLRSADAAAAAPPTMPDLVDPANLPANAPPLGALDLPGGTQGDIALPDLPSDLTAGSATPVANSGTAPLSKTSAKATAQAEKAAAKAAAQAEKDSAKAAVQAKKASIQATAQAERESPKAEDQPIKAAEPSAAPKSVSVEPAAAEPVPTAVPAATTKSSILPSAGRAVAEGPLTGLEAYFPMRSGRKWSFTSGTGEAMTVECVSRETAEGGGVKAVFKVTMGTATVEMGYLLTGGKLYLAPENGLKDKGAIQLQTVRKGEVPRWNGTPKDGTLAYYKAEAGPYHDGAKTLLDCITVTERVKKGAATVSLHKWVYARGIGVVADLTYGASDAPVPSKCFKLQEPTP